MRQSSEKFSQYTLSHLWVHDHLLVLFNCFGDRINKNTYVGLYLLLFHRHHSVESFIHFNQKRCFIPVLMYFDDIYLIRGSTQTFQKALDFLMIRVSKCCMLFIRYSSKVLFRDWHELL